MAKVTSLALCWCSILARCQCWMKFFAFGTAPEVEAVGDEGVVLGLDDCADDVDKEGRVALAEVLALGGLIAIDGVGGGVGAFV